jgi:hypothetical protein
MTTRPPRTAWTARQLATLRACYPDSKTDDLARHIGRPIKSVYLKAMQLGLKKSAEYLQSVQSGRIQRGRQHPAMVASQFQPGLTPWNKGKHFDSGGRSVLTRFKPGQMPPNRRSVGDIRITTDGNLEIKLGEGMRQWKTLSHYVWFVQHGTWPPKGYVLRAINGDNHDPRIENLELLTRSENMRRNSYHTNYPPEVKKLVQLKGAITRQVNRIAREAHA